ncbi:MAG: hypothetical protein HZA61_13380 [Candidatus Eisenbacteria bacterium]|uniref:Uncharacterized protein n=1 Tax=Eiseniibacteriota bacterium TaxID=2212470 RepID=A0A933WBM2_UNCEI|nr:hypothetical protein [Candidatus Eisenbacteria bacterium]
MQDAYVDTTFLGRRLTGTPEVRSGVVATANWRRPFGAGDWDLRVSPDLVIGDKLRRGTFSGELRRTGIDGWNWIIAPELELLDDRSFDLERREVRSSLLARTRRGLGWNGENSLEFRAGGEVLDLLSANDAFLLAHRNAQVGITFERTSLTSFDLRVEQRTQVRTFPDSTARNHFEPQLFVSASRDFAGNQSLGMQLGANWRTTFTPQESSRDRYLNWTGQLDWTLYAGPNYTFSLGAEEEWMQFASPDSTLDFDYAVHRVQGRARRQWGGTFSAALGGKGEWLQAPWNPLERYWEAATTLEFESLTDGAWYVLTPSVLWRQYEAESKGEGFDLQPAHSDFTGLEIFLMLEQAIPGGVRLRGTGVGRVEWHRDSADDARSLYFSLDVRRLF